MTWTTVWRRVRSWRFAWRDPDSVWWNLRLGARGERAAARHLRRKGLRILTQGYRTNRGEIDLIAVEDRILVFVEVKCRRRGNPYEAVTEEKRRRVIRAAQQFLSHHRLHGTSCRYDIVTVVWPEADQPPRIEHFRDAFAPQD